jgi:hypothetical protein
MILASPSTVVFHIGLERTGTTSFQRFCTNNANLLKRRSILYPTKAIAFRVDNHGPLVKSYLNEETGADFAIRSAQASKARVLLSLFQEIAKTSAKTVLISSEHFSSRFRSLEIKDLASDFGRYNCKILIVVRDHRQRFFSSYSTSIRSGGLATLDDFADVALAPDSDQFRYRNVINCWERSFGKSNIIVKPYISSNGFIETLFDSISPEKVALPKVEYYRDNKSLSPSVAEAYRLTNLALWPAPNDVCPQSYWRWLRKRYSQVRIERWLLKAGKDLRPGSWTLSEANVERLNRIANEDSQWLSENYGINIAGQDIEIGQGGNGSENMVAAAEILAAALKNQVRGQWNIIDAAMPALIPIIRVWDRWRTKQLLPGATPGSIFRSRKMSRK